MKGVTISVLLFIVVSSYILGLTFRTK